MRIGIYQFRPRLIPTILFLVLLPVLLRLGFWQIARAQEKREIIAAQNAKLALPPKVIDQPLVDVGNLQYHRLQVKGTFVAKYQVYIDNKIHQNQVGYDVVTPMRIGNSQQYVLVDRGWIPMGASRSELPMITTPKQDVSIVGIAKYNTKDVVSFGDANRSNTGWPAVVRWVNIKAIASETKLDLLPFMLLLDPQSQYGYVREWKFINMPPEKHISYAVQWFAMAFVLVVIYLVVNLKRISKTEKHDE
jgi:surfeit locus 1 family protein